MKKHIILAAIIMINYKAGAQHIKNPNTYYTGLATVREVTNSSHDSSNNMRSLYLEVSKKQRNTGWALLGSGTVLFGAGYLLGNSSASNFNDAGAGIVMAGIGLIAAFGSIPCFISSAVIHKKGRVAITREALTYPPVQAVLTSLSFTLPLSKQH